MGRDRRAVQDGCTEVVDHGGSGIEKERLRREEDGEKADQLKIRRIDAGGSRPNPFLIGGPPRIDDFTLQRQKLVHLLLLKS